MAIVALIYWKGVSLEDYDKVREQVGWERQPPDGGIFHIAAHDGEALRIVDLWETAEDIQRFVEQRLMPGVAAVGLSVEPQVEVYPAHAIFAPGYAPKA